MVLGISTVLGVIGVVSAFGLFYLGERVFHLDRPHIQTLMYLKLSVAGHLTIFLTRTRGPFWSIRPARILWMAVLGTQIVATLIAVYGVFMTPLGWKWAGFVWGYALIWFLINDRIKLLAYRIFDPIKAVPAHQAAAETKPEVKDGPKPEAKVQPAPDSKAESKPAAKDTPNPEVKVELKPEVKDEPKPEVKDGLKPEAKTEPKPETKVEPKPEVKAPSEVTPQLVKRVHELYEELGREEVRAVQEWEKKEQDAHKDAS
jgi:H+-transporting ATPase